LFGPKQYNTVWTPEEMESVEVGSLTMGRTETIFWTVQAATIFLKAGKATTCFAAGGEATRIYGTPEMVTIR
jgi:hypothetical protein